MSGSVRGAMEQSIVPTRRNDRTDPGEIVRQVWRANKGGLGSMLGRDRRDFRKHPA